MALGDVPSASSNFQVSSKWRSGPSSRGSNFGAAALTVGAVAAVGGRGLLLQRRATAVKKKGVRVVEGKERAVVNECYSQGPRMQLLLLVMDSYGIIYYIIHTHTHIYIYIYAPTRSSIV